MGPQGVDYDTRELVRSHGTWLKGTQDWLIDDHRSLHLGDAKEIPLFLSQSF